MKHKKLHLKVGSLALMSAVLSACQTHPQAGQAKTSIEAELAGAAAAKPQPAKVPDRVLRALIPPISQEPPRPAQLPELRFDLAVTNASAAQVFQAIGSGSRYSILLPTNLPGTISVNLKDVTVREALDTLRELYGYEYRIEGTRVFIQPMTLQTRVFEVAYPAARRVGRSETRVTSGSIATSSSSTSGSSSGTSTTGTTTSGAEGSQVSTSTDADFWKELDASLKAVLGTEGGRQIVVSQQTGVVVVRGYPKDIREVENYLRAARLSIERQVMLEAKIIEVALNEGFESGINWAGLSGGNHRFSVGADTSRINVPGSIGTAGGVQAGSIVTAIDTSTTPPTVTPSTLGQVLTSPATSGGAGVLGMAFTAAGFNGLLSFLETQGKVHVLSSPRVAAVNNQKAVLRVGTDDFFVTNISTTTTTSASGNVTTPTISVQPFFSGISLDVTPQINEDGMVTLHIRPAVSTVSERTKVLNLGTLGNFALPLASSNINEADTVVRVADGVIVAIGGLMQQREADADAKVPGAGDVPLAGNMFKRKSRGSEKRELVFLLKPTVIRSDSQWQADISGVEQRVRAMQPRPEPRLQSSPLPRTE